MATVNILRCYRGNEHVPVLKGRPNGKDAKTSSATSQTSDLTASRDEYWVVTVSGGALWVQFGDSPTASSGNDWLLPDGASLTVQAESGETVAFVDA